MLFSESDLRMTSNPMAILDEAAYLSESESLIRPQTIPVKENTRIGAYTVNFDDIERLAESYGADYVDAMVAVAEASGIDVEYLKVAVNEADIITDPEIVLALPEASVVIAPLSENDIVYQFCEAVLDEYVETQDETVFDKLFTEGTIGANLKWIGRGLNQVRKDRKEDSFLLHPMRKIRERRADHEYNARYNWNVNNTDDVKKNAAGRAKALAKMPHKFLGKIIDNIDSFQHKPRNVIARKIASLRKLYSKFLERSKQYIDDERASILRRAAYYITKAIDKLLGWLQDASNNVQYYFDKRK